MAQPNGLCLITYVGFRPPPPLRHHMKSARQYYLRCFNLALRLDLPDLCRGRRLRTLSRTSLVLLLEDKCTVPPISEPLIDSLILNRVQKIYRDVGSPRVQLDVLLQNSGVF